MATIYGVKDSVISQGFGPSSFNYSRYGITRNNGYFHDGDDLAGPSGTVFPTKENGSTYHGWEPGGLGNYVLFTGDSGYTLLIGHNSRLGKPGRVSAGEPLCYRGSTGNSTGPHFHVTVYPPKRDYNNGVKGAIPPSEYFNKITGTPMPYSDKQYTDAKAGAINFLFIAYHDEGASEPQVKQYLNTDLIALENSLKDPDNPASEQHRNCIKKIWKQYMGREIKDPELRERCKQNNNQLREDLEREEEHAIYMKGKK